MRYSLLRGAAAICLLALTGAGPPAPAPDEAIVVTGQIDPIVVNGHSVRCRPLAHDPQDAWRPSRPPTRSQSVLLPQSDGQGFELVSDAEQLSGPGVWRRVGTGIDQYVFRAPLDGKLMCIGGKAKYPAGYGQLRDIVDATPYRGKRVRFTAWAASRGAARVDFWLAAGNPRASWYGHGMKGAPGYNPNFPGRGWLYDGGNSNGHDWHGSHGWTPVLLEIGPIAKGATNISFGFVLVGSGDVWLYDPKFEAVEPDDPFQRKGDVYVIGSDRPAAQR